MLASKSFSIGEFYDQVLGRFEYELEGLVKNGVFDSSLPLALMERIRYLLKQKQLLFSKKKEGKSENGAETAESTNLASEKDAESISQLRVQNDVNPQVQPIQQEEDDFEFFQRAEKEQEEKKKTQQIIHFQHLKFTKIQVKQEVKITPVQQQVEDSELQGYLKSQQQFNNAVEQIRSSAKISIIGVVGVQRIKRFHKPKGKNMNIMLNLSEIYVRLNYYPFEQKFYKVKNLITLSYDEFVVKQHVQKKKLQEIIKEQIYQNEVEI